MVYQMSFTEIQFLEYILGNAANRPHIIVLGGNTGTQQDSETDNGSSAAAPSILTLTGGSVDNNNRTTNPRLRGQYRH